jgi:hypothetical protein
MARNNVSTEDFKILATDAEKNTFNFCYLMHTKSMQDTPKNPERRLDTAVFRRPQQ